MIRNINQLLKKIGKQSKHEQSTTKPEATLQEDFDQNAEILKSIYDKCSDVMFRSFLLFGEKKALLIYIEGLSDVDGIDEYVLTPLMQKTAAQLPSGKLEDLLPIAKVKKVRTFADCIESIAAGNPLLLHEGPNEGFSLGLPKWEKRGIEEPSAEAGIRGPREGFNESLQVSTSQLRRIIKSPALKMESLKIGSYTTTSVVLAYIEGIVDETLIEEIHNRLNKIKIDGILESAYIEEMIEDNPYSPFPQILSTERPDVACANLLEGRAVIITDGTPFCLVVPVSFFSMIQSHEDYYQRFLAGTFIRWLRYIFLGISLLLPSFYVAVLTFHQEMVPGALLLSMASSRESVPFPAVVEALLMEITFEALREAGVRLPKQVGAAVSIVGALVIGQAAVQAGLVSAPMVIVVAITGIASFMIPRYFAGLAIRMLRFPIMLLASSLGILGIMMGIIAIVIHLCSLRSFGVSYLAPLGPLKSRELKDVLWRAPWWMMNTRPHFTGKYNEFRQPPENGSKPQPE